MACQIRFFRHRSPGRVCRAVPPGRICPVRRSEQPSGSGDSPRGVSGHGYGFPADSATPVEGSAKRQVRAGPEPSSRRRCSARQDWCFPPDSEPFRLSGFWFICRRLSPWRRLGSILPGIALGMVGHWATGARIGRGNLSGQPGDGGRTCRARSASRARHRRGTGLAARRAWRIRRVACADRTRSCGPGSTNPNRDERRQTVIGRSGYGMQGQPIPGGR